MNDTVQTYSNLVAKIQVYMSNKTKNSNYFSLLRNSASYKNMLNFMAIVYYVVIINKTTSSLAVFRVLTFSRIEGSSC